MSLLIGMREQERVSVGLRISPLGVGLPVTWSGYEKPQGSPAFPPSFAGLLPLAESQSSHTERVFC